MELGTPHDPGIDGDLLETLVSESETLVSEINRTPPDIELITTLEGAIRVDETRVDDDKFAFLSYNMKFYKTI